MRVAFLLTNKTAYKTEAGKTIVIWTVTSYLGAGMKQNTKNECSKYIGKSSVLLMPIDNH